MDSRANPGNHVLDVSPDHPRKEPPSLLAYYGIRAVDIVKLIRRRPHAAMPPLATVNEAACYVYMRRFDILFQSRHRLTIPASRSPSPHKGNSSCVIYDIDVFLPALRLPVSALLYYSVLHFFERKNKSID